MNNFPNLTSLKSWALSNDLKFVDQDKSLPYILKDGLYHYFGQAKKAFVLLMVSTKDIMEVKS